MINAKKANLEDLSMTARMILTEALARGWEARLYYLGTGQMTLKRLDGKTLEVFSSMPPTTTAPAAHLANNKYLTKLLYQDKGLPIPDTYLAKELKEARLVAKNLLDQGKKLVVKPLNAAHGHGVSMDVSMSQLESAVTTANQYSKEVLIQEYLESAIDLRVTCLNFKFIAAVARIPARVKGNGRNSVRRLIEIENKNPQRGENYTKPLNKIDIDLAEKYLGSKINHVPAVDQYFQVIGTANVGTGGETIDITEDLPGWLIDLAEKAAKLSQLPCCGIDFMAKKMPKVSHKLKDLEPKIVEINICPSLFLHEIPTYGKPRPVIKHYVDYLASI